MFQTQFQTFDDAESGAHSAPRLAALRAELKARGVSGFILPRADAHQNEYVAPSDERLAWLTGFTGSARPAARVRGCALLFFLGRFYLATGQSNDNSLF